MFGSLIALMRISLTFLPNSAANRFRVSLMVLAALGVMLATVRTGQVHAIIALPRGQAWAPD